MERVNYDFASRLDFFWAWDFTFSSFIQAPCIDSMVVAAAVFASEVEKLKAAQLKPKEQITLEPFERDHAVVVGVYRPTKSKKQEAAQ